MSDTRSKKCENQVFGLVEMGNPQTILELRIHVQEMRTTWKLKYYVPATMLELYVVHYHNERNKDV